MTPADRLREKAKRIRDRQSLAQNKRPLEKAFLLNLLADVYEGYVRDTTSHPDGCECHWCDLLSRIEEIA